MTQYQGVWTLQNAAQLQSTQRWVTDPLYKNTTLLLQADDAANGAQNNTFLDSSSNSFTITRNGNTTQGSFTPFSSQPGAWGVYYSGVANNNATNVPANAAYSFGTGDFTIEAWVYIPPIANTNGKMLLDSRPTSTNGAFWTFGFSNTGQFTAVTMSSGGTTLTSPSPLPTNQWVHIAFTRASGALNLWVNGISVASASGNTNNISSDLLKIGYNAFSSVASDTWFEGYASNIRIVKGVAVYTGTFTPPVTGLQKTQSAGINIAAITGSQTSLLIHQSNRLVDNSDTAASITTLNTWPSVQPFSPFAPQFQWTPSVIGGSGYFDGSTDNIQTTGANTNLSIGTGDFTFECWAYLLSASGDPGIMQLAGGPFGTNLPTYANSVGILVSTGSGLWLMINNGSFTAGSISARINQWTHLAVCRSGTTHRLFVNGVQALSVTDSSNYTTQYFAAGCAYGTNFTSNSYISNIRFVRGTAVYTGAFTPPTRPLSASGAESASAYPSTTNVNTSFASSATSLFLNFTNAGIYDGTMKNNLETVGNAQVSTAVVKYGSGSMYFDGTGDYLDSPSIINAQFGTGDFTIEGWLYLNSLAATQVLFEFRAASGATYGQIYITTGGVLRYYLPTDVGTSNTFSTGVWTHFAITRSVGILRMFIGGVQGYSNTYTTAMDATRLRIGADVSGGSGVNGYIDDLRITKGIARYIQNFIPPSVALPRQ